jgi:DNA-nicking Smr family endonuclease
LHGLKVEDAIFQLKAFVKDCFNRNDKVIKVIHGKGLHSEGGTSILRKAVWDWLNSEGKTYISFFRKATKKHGGSGAVIIWLK